MRNNSVHAMACGGGCPTGGCRSSHATASSKLCAPTRKACTARGGAWPRPINVACNPLRKAAVAASRSTSQRTAAAVHPSEAPDADRLVANCRARAAAVSASPDAMAAESSCNCQSKAPEACLVSASMGLCSVPGREPGAR
eukprot:CAMPEP_0177190634 /NCGR_PEP_ID=MMETSP0367-20130122/20931_1 /TAXON_ID=447022 ORGANISM="Scrippsiella hangoei-like, Strain SHHI-4" /NCGR_SAMPLE_ID=MMETSP0367 /ASSEMBLY_ACC=CAM_ASM_000362 /LENGTH=140 /DNA_ID=CAMNT_0018638301 /DNA_START=130 /DNA_END=552 /DNA_ORIENTATION=+